MNIAELGSLALIQRYDWTGDDPVIIVLCHNSCHVLHTSYNTGNNIYTWHSDLEFSKTDLTNLIPY